MSERILVVDDEKEIADLVEVYLLNDNYEVTKFYNGKEALESALLNPPDLAVLDVMLPDMDGFEICKRIREQHYFPIIMLTAKVEDMDKMERVFDNLIRNAVNYSYANTPICLKLCTEDESIVIQVSKGSWYGTVMCWCIYFITDSRKCDWKFCGCVFFPTRKESNRGSGLYVYI